jgi:hypothetical protein
LRSSASELDGKVDAFGIGGTDLYIYAGDRRYTMRDSVALMRGAKKTPYADGSGLKNTLERETGLYLQNKGIVDFSKCHVLMVCAVDRFGMAESLARLSRSMVFGDMIYGLGIPIPVRSWRLLQILARITLPLVSLMPIEWLYPTGEKQEKNTPRGERYFAEADVIAGDYHLIGRYMPEDLRGKIVLTNTTTPENVAEFRRRGVRLLITTTPVFEGRSFGTNVMEAVIAAISDKPISEMTPEDYFEKLKALDWKPNVQELNPAT